jgi:hypothetical protein
MTKEATTENPGEVTEKKTDTTMTEKADKAAPKVETRVGRLVGLFQSEIKNLAGRIEKLEGKTPTESLEEEIHTEEAKEELENIFDEVGRRVTEMLGFEA